MSLKPHPLAGRRIGAYLLDCIGYLGVAAAELPIGFWAFQQGWGTNPVLMAVLSSIPPVAATAIAALGEAGERRSTWGKRRLGIRVDFTGEAGLGRALVRNTVKIFLPWTIGHVVAFRAANGAFQAPDAITITATIATYAIFGVFGVMGGFGSGRGPHDRLAGTQVVARLATSPKAHAAQA